MSDDVLVNGFAVSPSADGGAAFTMGSADGQTLSVLLTAEDRAALATALLGDVRGYVVLVHPRDAGVVREGWEMGWSEIHPTREAAEADAAHAQAGDDAWDPRPEAHVGVVTALPASAEVSDG